MPIPGHVSVTYKVIKINIESGGRRATRLLELQILQLRLVSRRKGREDERGERGAVGGSNLLSRGECERRFPAGISKARKIAVVTFTRAAPRRRTASDDDDVICPRDHSIYVSAPSNTRDSYFM